MKIKPQLRPDWTAFELDGAMFHCEVETDDRTTFRVFISGPKEIGAVRLHRTATPFWTVAGESMLSTYDTRILAAAAVARKHLANLLLAPEEKPTDVAMADRYEDVPAWDVEIQEQRAIGFRVAVDRLRRLALATSSIELLDVIATVEKEGPQ